MCRFLKRKNAEEELHKLYFNQIDVMDATFNSKYSELNASKIYTNPVNYTYISKDSF